MFDDRAFRTWPRVITVALTFAFLFGLIAVLSDLLFDGVLRLSPRALGFGLLAFIGYLGVAGLIRSRMEDTD
ncbi:hypothetical protein GQ464_005800 [Rhodocaloribacter litoris]|uniref:hypothetical protein n=1 Tax=Rhodocaloribacter litoris TaxID=2558931 RepID=UPI001423DAC5|nr:hypothetical protein [Rhodocaloribacter litoris]QXD16463.1 hypothetical protein GQ464_005800 [Rhodocaloribacter litoris]GIV59433.1 MAG: hypothetical protein KatS3mg043_0522 [Rhodothermaceae bacterium]